MTAKAKKTTKSYTRLLKEHYNALNDKTINFSPSNVSPSELNLAMILAMEAPLRERELLTFLVNGGLKVDTSNAITNTVKVAVGF